MKTIIITAVFIFTAALLMANSRVHYPVASDDWMAMNEEAYVNDIPFDTWKISQVAFPPDFTLTDESYVDDIPFNTAEIAKEVLLDKVIEQKDESSVNDIPFNTNEIYNDILLDRYISRWQDECNVCDIPFSSCVIVGMTQCGEGYRIIISNDFILEMEDYLEDFSIRVKGLETLSFGYSF